MALSQSGFSQRAAGTSGRRAAALAVALAFAPSAFALYNDRVELFADEAFNYDSNVFRLSKNVDPVPITGSSRKSDDWLTTTVGINVDVPWSLQRFQLNYSLSDLRYQHFKELDHHAYQFRGDWQWAVRRELTGDTGYAQQQNLASFANIQANTPDIIRSKQAWFNGAYLVTPSWRLHTDFNAGEARHSAANQQINNLDAASAEAGVDYVTPRENRIGVAARFEKGRSPDSILLQGVEFNNDYRQASLGLQARWALTEHSRLDGRVDYSKREYSQFNERNYSGPTMRGTYTWSPTVKTRVATTIYRDVAPLEDIQSRFVLVTGVKAQPQWDVTEKVSVRGNLEYSKWDFHGDPALGNSFTHRVSAIGGGLVWKPARDILVQGTYQHEVRTSTVPTGDYKVDTVIVEGRVGF